MSATAQKKQAYVALGEGGLLKVGHTVNPGSRQLSLQREFKAKGDRLIQFVPVDAIYRAWSVEYGLIRFCEAKYQRHSGREWFSGACFATVLERAQALTEEYRSEPPYPEWTPEMQARSKERSQRLGGVSAVAARLGIKPPSVSGWIEDGRDGIPDGRLIELGAVIEREVGIPRWELRPNDWHLIWPELIGTDGAPHVEERKAA